MMVKDKSISKLYAFALAAVFALTLAGCGGGGGGGTTDTTDPMPTDPPPPTEAQKLATAKTAAMTAYEAAKAALAAVMDDASHDMDSYDMAQDALNEAKAANAVAQAATTSAAAEDAQAIVETARDNVVMYAGMVTAAATKAAERVVQEAANKVAGTKETAIATEAAQTTDDGAGGEDATTDHAIAISRDRDGTEVKITVDGAADDDPKFTQAMDLGGGRTMHARAMEADSDGNVVEEVVIVSTDIEAPEAVAFAKFEEDLAGTLSQALTVRKDGVTVDADNPADSFDVSAAISGVATRVSNIMAAGFSSSGGGSLTYPADNSATEDKDEAFEATGTYNGAMGTYRCAAASGTCSVTYDAEGKISAIGTDWIFTPAEGAMSDQPDYDYYHYGFWLKKTTDKDGVLTYNEVETFAGSTLAAATNTVAGTASYAGGATGVYVKNVYNSDRTLDTASSGHFTADVNLMAYFGGNDVAVNKQNSIEGTIDNFMLSREGDDGSGWSVDVAASISTADVTGTAKGGVTGSDGSFTGTFRGDDSMDVDGTATPIGHKVLVGEFNATFTDGSVAGGYGARRQDN